MDRTIELLQPIDVSDVETDGRTVDETMDIKLLSNRLTLLETNISKIMQALNAGESKEEPETPAENNEEPTEEPTETQED